MVVLGVLTSLAIIGEEERAGCFTLILLLLSMFCFSLSLMPWIGLQSVIAAFPGHTHLRFQRFLNVEYHWKLILY